MTGARLIDGGHRRCPERCRSDRDNALAESTIGLFKTELIKPPGDLADLRPRDRHLTYVDWHNHRRLYSGPADLPPADVETVHQPNEPASTRRRPKPHLAATKPGAV